VIYSGPVVARALTSHTMKDEIGEHVEHIEEIKNTSIESANSGS
jgi:hypothetical protein